MPKPFVDPTLSVAEQEEAVLRFWVEQNIFQKSLAATKEGEPFVIYDGPPTANAKPPLHTSLPMSFKDLVGRYQTMRGRFVPRQAGWDTHGLPVEVQVEKALGLSGKQDILSLVPGDQRASVQKFNEICRSSVWEFKQEWDKFVPRVGYWTDTENPYVTYDRDYVQGVWGVFKQIWDRGLVTKDYKVLPYCPRCGTGLSAAEVAQEYQDIKDVTAFVAFPIVDRPGRSFLAWTTTPWTLPGNVALAVGPEIDYVAVRQEAGEYVLAKSRLEALQGDYVIVEEMKGADLVGLRYQPPFPDVFADAPEPKHQVLAGSFVTTEDGTGIVHIAPMYGEEDFQLAKSAGFPMRHTVGLDGRFLNGLLGGAYIRDALGAILTHLTERGALYAKQSHTHSYPHCWRCKTPLVYYAKDSWYIKMSTLREQLVTANENVEWVPGHIKEGRFGDFIREARDWAVSRERFWGTPLPVWRAEDGESICVGSIDELRQFAELPDDFDPHRPYVDDIVIQKDGKQFRREPFVMDVWFDSGAMPYASGREAKGQFPADYISEAIDQTRGWFYSLMAIGVALGKGSPYRRVVCMGHLMDEQGRKMSKSLGNVLQPGEVFAQVGADAVRWFYYTVNAPGESKNFGIKDVQVGYRKSLLLVQNMLNYYSTYAELAGFEPTGAQEIENEMTWLDRWAAALEAQVIERVTAYLDSYDFMRAGRELEAYIDQLSTWYLRRSRKRDDRAFFETFRHLLMNLATMLAPFTPFAAERFYQELRTEGRAESVHLAAWPKPWNEADASLLPQMALVREIVELGQAARATAKIKVRQPLAAAFIAMQGELPEEAHEIIKDELNVLRLELSASDTGLAVTLDTHLTDELREMGDARELLRQLQQLRKTMGLKPGQPATLLAGPYERERLEPLLEKHPHVLREAYLILDDDSWEHEGTEEIDLNGETVTVSLRP